MADDTLGTFVGHGFPGGQLPSTWEQTPRPNVSSVFAVVLVTNTLDAMNMRINSVERSASLDFNPRAVDVGSDGGYVYVRGDGWLAVFEVVR